MPVLPSTYEEATPSARSSSRASAPQSAGMESLPRRAAPAARSVRRAVGSVSVRSRSASGSGTHAATLRPLHSMVCSWPDIASFRNCGCFGRLAVQGSETLVGCVECGALARLVSPVAFFVQLIVAGQMSSATPGDVLQAMYNGCRPCRAGRSLRSPSLRGRIRLAGGHPSPEPRTNGSLLVSSTRRPGHSAPIQKEGWTGPLRIGVPQDNRHITA